MKLRVLNSMETRQALPMREVVEMMKQAFSQLSAGRANVPLRSRIDVEEHEGVTLFMPAQLIDSNDMALKVVSVFSRNPLRELPTIHALVVVIEPQTGRPIALIEGGTLTAIRTGAGSGAATDLLASPEAKRVAILGAGVQARTQLEAVCAVRSIQSASIFSLEPEQSQSFVVAVASQPWAPLSIEVADNAAAAVSDADIICTATTSTTPVFSQENLKTGVHINAIGSFTPEMQEIDPRTVERAALFVDSRQAVWEEAGDLIIPLHEGKITKDHVLAEIGEIVNGEHKGRKDPDQITLYKSVGVAVQDAASAGLALKNAAELDLGKIVEL